MPRIRHYVPRSGGTVDWLAGPKIVHFDRVEWVVIPDPATASGALTNGEVDWWENPPNDMLPLLERVRAACAWNWAHRWATSSTGIFNHLHPPFDKLAVRKVVLEAMSQADFMTAAAGTDPEMWKDGVGIFAPGHADGERPRPVGSDRIEARPADAEKGAAGRGLPRREGSS